MVAPSVAQNIVRRERPMVLVTLRPLLPAGRPYPSMRLFFRRQA
jgi:hypothetical protein